MLIFNVGIVLISACCMTIAVYHARLYEVDQTITCNGIYGTVVEVLERVQSGMMCAMSCVGHHECASSVYNAVTKLCALNNETWPYPIKSGCTTDTVYFINRGLMKPVCHPGKRCTNQLHGVRLCDGEDSGICNPRYGRVEVLHQGIWGSICSDISGYSYSHTDQSNTNVLCRMLGYTRGEVQPAMFFGQRTGYIWLDDVNCTGDEESIYHCPANAWGDADCEQLYDLGVSCY